MLLTSSKREEIWNEVLSRVEKELDDTMIYSTFFSESRLVNIEEDVAIVQVPTIFAKQQLSTTYNELLKSTFYNVTGSNFSIKIVDAYEVKEETKQNINESDSFIDFNSNLNPNYTFESFVVGPSNREGQAASLAAALNPGRFYNPLFLFGKSGLGKTHLLHAVGNYIRSKNKSMRVLYISSDQFIEEYFRCIREKGFDALKNRFRSIDVILIDDIQFLASREKVGEYFFSIFNLFINSNKQIIMTSDRPPLELKGLEDRLVSRFASGLSVGLTSPEYETSLKILKNKIKEQNMDENMIDDEVLKYIAERFSNDVRQLEGALNKLLFTAISFNNTNSITMSDAIDSFKLIGIPGEKKQLSIEKIKIVVAEYYNISPNELSSKIRTSKITMARHIAMYLCRSLLSSSLSQIGNEFGGRDHTTVINGIEKVEKLCKNNEDYLIAVTELKSRLK
jgi:chromosomal replication initiator protein